MFFGKEVKTNQNKATAMVMDADVRVSQAVLDPATKCNKKEPVCLLAEIQGKSFLLAVLDPSQSWQCPLDLMLSAGTEVKFYTRGQGTIHLTGYELDEQDDDYELSMSSDEEMEEEEDQDDAESKHAAKKIKVKNSPATNGVKNHAALKMKPSGDGNGMQDSDDDDDDDEDFSDDEDLSFGSEDGDGQEVDSSDMDDVDLDGLSSDDEDLEDEEDDDDEEEENDDDDESD